MSFEFLQRSVETRQQAMLRASPAVPASDYKGIHFEARTAQDTAR